MKHKKTKLLSILLAIVMMVGLMPATASAEVDSYTITVKGGKAYDSEDNVITSAKPGDTIYIRPDAVPGEYVTNWTANPDVTFKENGTYAKFTMPANNVTLTPNYAEQTSYNIDLSGGGSVNVDNFAASALLEIKGMYIIPIGAPIELDLDGDGNNDISVAATFVDPTNPPEWTMEKLDTTNLTGTYSVTQANTYEYSPINIKFDNSGNPAYKITVKGGKAYSDIDCTNVITEAAAGEKVYLLYNTPAANQYVTGYTVTSPGGVELKQEKASGFMYRYYVEMPEGNLAVTVNTAKRKEYVIDLTKGEIKIPTSELVNIPFDYTVGLPSDSEPYLLDLDGDSTNDIMALYGLKDTVFTPLPGTNIKDTYVQTHENYGAGFPYSKYIYKFPNYEISEVSVTFPEPKAGDKTSDFDYHSIKVPAGANYFPPLIEGASYFLDADGKPFTGTFERGKKYFFDIIVVTEDPFYFKGGIPSLTPDTPAPPEKDRVKFMVNGKKIAADAPYPTKVVAARYEFTIGGGGSSGSSSSSGSATTKYTLTYNTNGGNSIIATKHEKNATVNLTATPIREGYDFTGWFADKELKNAVTSVKMDGNKTVYAGWKEAGAGVDTPVENENAPLLVVTINSMKYLLNGKTMTMDSAPFIDGNNRTMLPVRVIANALGITNDNIKWDSATKTASFTRADGKVVSCTVNSNVIKVGDENVTIDTVPVIRNNRIYLPMRALFNAFDVPDENILWDAAARTVTVTKKD